MRNTITEALREMRGLHTTDAGRLRGVHLRYIDYGMPPQGLAATPQPWRDRLQAAIDGRRAGNTTPASPEYLVFSDGLVIAVLTAAAHVELPDYPCRPTRPSTSTPPCRPCATCTGTPSPIWPTGARR
ncbi:MAG: hypothetical protein QG597_2203 [Actinomycetota bacterium]|nr:hypothetical protein [Actinomycetota bacterium]